MSQQALIKQQNKFRTLVHLSFCSDRHESGCICMIFQPCQNAKNNSQWPFRNKVHFALKLCSYLTVLKHIICCVIISHLYFRCEDIILGLVYFSRHTSSKSIRKLESNMTRLMKRKTLPSQNKVVLDQARTARRWAVGLRHRLRAQRYVVLRCASGRCGAETFGALSSQH